MSDLPQPNRDINTTRRENQRVMETRVRRGTKSTGCGGGGDGGERWPELGQGKKGFEVIYDRGSHKPNMGLTMGLVFVF